MEKFIILADVACDLSEEVRSFVGMEDYAKGHVHFSDGRDLPTALDWSHIDRAAFYKDLSNKRLEINTAPPSPEEMYLLYKKYAAEGYNILSMSISSKISSTYNVACSAAERVRAEYPDCTVYCFDSYRMSGALGLLVMYAHLFKKEGKSFEEIIRWLEDNKMRVHQMGPIDDLIFVARRGRITMGKAVMGNFAGVKPMGDCTTDGYVSVLHKVKGIRKALDATARYVKEVAVAPESQYLLICHSDRQAYAEALQSQLETLIQPKKIFVSDVFTGSGANVGPGMVGVYFLGEPVSEDQSVEKAILTGILDKAGK